MGFFIFGTLFETINLIKMINYDTSKNIKS